MYTDRENCGVRWVAFKKNTLVLHLRPIVLLFDWVAVASVLVGVLSPVITGIWELPTSAHALVCVIPRLLASPATPRNLEIVSRCLAADI